MVAVDEIEGVVTEEVEVLEGVGGSERPLHISYVALAGNSAIPTLTTVLWDEFTTRFSVSEVRVAGCSVDPSSPDYCHPKECDDPDCRLPKKAPAGQPHCTHKRHKGCRFKDGDCFCGATFSVDLSDGLPRRQIAYAISASIASLDVDWKTRAIWEAAVVRLRLLCLAAILHTTHSSGRPPKHEPEDGTCSFRVIVRPNREILKAEWHAFIRGLAILLEVPLDKTCRDITRLMYYPSRPSDAPEVEFEILAGGDVDVDQCIALGGGAVETAPTVSGDDDDGPVGGEWDGGEPMDDDEIEHCRAALRNAGPSIDGGGGGHHATGIGAILFNDYNATWGQAWMLTLEWNRGNMPPWAEDELDDLRGKIIRGYRSAQKPLGNARTTAVHLCAGLRESLRAQGLYPPEPDDGDVEVPADLGPGSAGDEEGQELDDNLLTRSMQSSLSGKPKPKTPKPMRRIECDIDDMATQGQVDLAGDLDEKRRLYQRAESLVQVAVDGRARKSVVSKRRPAANIRPASVNDIRARMSSQAQWYQVGEIEGNKPKRDKNCLPPREVAERIHSIGTWGVPLLRGISERPLLRPDGTLVATEGYDAITDMYVHIPPELESVASSVPDAIDQEMATAAAVTLLEPFREFPFVAKHHKAAFIAFVCTLVCRSAVDGCCPFFAATGPQPNLGKTLLLDSGTAIANGHMAAHTSQREDTEKEKTEMDSYLLDGSSSVIVDNCTRPVGGDNWDVYATARTIAVRLFHKQTIGYAPADAIFSFTGKNIRFEGDMAERLLQIKLESDVPNPGDREFELKEPFLPWIGTQRGRLMAAALTIVAGYIRAGSPDPIGVGGKFPEWNVVIRSAVKWAFGVDPCAGMRKDNESGDEKIQETKGLLHAWLEAFKPGEEKATKEVIASTDAGLRAALEGVCQDKQGRLDARRLGQHLGSIKGRVFSVKEVNYKFEQGARGEAGYGWKLTRL